MEPQTDEATPTPGNMLCWAVQGSSREVSNFLGPWQSGVGGRDKSPPPRRREPARTSLRFESEDVESSISRCITTEGPCCACAGAAPTSTSAQPGSWGD